MGQVSEEKSLDPPSGRLGCNLDDYIKRESPTRRGIEDCKEGKLEKLREREREREREYYYARTNVNLHLSLKPRCIVVFISNVCCFAFPGLHIYQAHIPIPLY